MSDDFFKRLRRNKPAKQADEGSAERGGPDKTESSDKPGGRVTDSSREREPRERLDPVEREKRFAQSLLENESLTSGLDDSAAQALLDWGMVLARRTAQADAPAPVTHPRATPAQADASAPPEDDRDPAAETQADARELAVARLLRAARDVALGAGDDREAQDVARRNLQTQARLVYGQTLDLPDLDRRRAALPRSGEVDPAAQISDLRRLLEATLDTPPPALPPSIPRRDPDQERDR